MEPSGHLPDNQNSQQQVLRTMKNTRTFYTNSKTFPRHGQLFQVPQLLVTQQSVRFLIRFRNFMNCLYYWFGRVFFQIPKLASKCEYHTIPTTSLPVATDPTVIILGAIVEANGFRPNGVACKRNAGYGEWSASSCSKAIFNINPIGFYGLRSDRMDHGPFVDWRVRST